MVKKYQNGTINIHSNHCFYSKRTDTVSPKSIIRIMSELSSLKKDLPINWDSSVLLRIIPTNTNLISFMISGPKDTPYHNGLFEFHAYFPDTYPNIPPNVLINTTDNGKVRFNPNLYSNGKVCLSLLGTWNGTKGESWISDLSTFFQVIISIQSLILVEEPYFNEPGYEKDMTTENGKKKSKEYNNNIQYETTRVAMLGMLENPPIGYEDFIKEHFKMKKDEILENLSKCINDSDKPDNFNTVFNKLKKHLEAL
jgi:baculoviral IAP repeat-containing protein 6